MGTKYVVPDRELTPLALSKGKDLAQSVSRTIVERIILDAEGRIKNAYSEYQVRLLYTVKVSSRADATLYGTTMQWLVDHSDTEETKTAYLSSDMYNIPTISPKATSNCTLTYEGVDITYRVDEPDITKDSTTVSVADELVIQVKWGDRGFLDNILLSVIPESFEQSERKHI